MYRPMPFAPPVMMATCPSSMLPSHFPRRCRGRTCRVAGRPVPLPGGAGAVALAVFRATPCRGRGGVPHYLPTPLWLLLQGLAEEVQHVVPGDRRLLGVVALGVLVVVEGVLGVRVDTESERLVVLPHLLDDGRDAGIDALVQSPVDREHRGRDLVGVRRRVRPVPRHRRLDAA